MMTGYGRMACALLEHAQKQSIRTNAIWRNSGALDTHSAAMQSLIKQPIVPAAGGICLGYPTIIPRFGNLVTAGPRICVTMFESDELPDGWVEELNRCQAVVVPSDRQAQIFKSNGVNVPIRVVPLGIGEKFHYVDRPPLDDRKFTFITWGDRGFRKGWNDAIMAFMGAFGDDERVQLIIKCRPDTKFPDFSNPNIHTWKVDFDDQQLHEFYAAADCMVFPSYGEGFGLPPREFAATGGLVMATEWWADDIAEWGIPIGYQMVPAWRGHDRFDGLGKWAQPHHFQLMMMMRGVYEKCRESDVAWRYIKDFCKSAAHKVKQKWTWDGFAEQVVTIWRDVLVSHHPHRRRPVEIVAGESVTRPNEPVNMSAPPSLPKHGEGDKQSSDIARLVATKAVVDG